MKFIKLHKNSVLCDKSQYLFVSYFFNGVFYNEFIGRMSDVRKYKQHEFNTVWTHYMKLKILNEKG